jgi:hypothetical protein
MLLKLAPGIESFPFTAPGLRLRHFEECLPGGAVRACDAAALGHAQHGGRGVRHGQVRVAVVLFPQQLMQRVLQHWVVLPRRARGHLRLCAKCSTSYVLFITSISGY